LSENPWEIWISLKNPSWSEEEHQKSIKKYDFHLERIKVKFRAKLKV
jgi:hypothetical protein